MPPLTPNFSRHDLISNYTLQRCLFITVRFELPVSYCNVNCKKVFFYSLCFLHKLDVTRMLARAAMAATSTVSLKATATGQIKGFHGKHLNRSLKLSFAESNDAKAQLETLCKMRKFTNMLPSFQKVSSN